MWHQSSDAYLEKRQEEVELLLSSAAIEVTATEIKHCANQPDAEEVIWHIERIDRLPRRRAASYIQSACEPAPSSRCARLTMAKGDDAVKGVEDNEGIDRFIAVKLGEILDLGNPALVKLEVVLFQSKRNLFQ